MELEKKLLSPTDIEAQAVLELPDRQTLQACAPMYTVNLFSNNDNSFNYFSFNNYNEAVNFCFFILNLNTGWQCTIFQQSPISLGMGGVTTPDPPQLW